MSISSRDPTVTKSQLGFAIPTLKREYNFRIRKSLAEYVDDELNEQRTSVFHQRVFILAKNLHREESSNHSDATTEVRVLGHVGNVVSTDHAALAPSGNGNEPYLDQGDDSEASLRVERLTMTYKFIQDEPVESEHDLEAESSVSAELKDDDPSDFYNSFFVKLRMLRQLCARKTFTPDPLCGLFLYMGDYTMLMVESSEDMIAEFCRKLAQIAGEYFENNRVLLVEDKVSEQYFDDFISRRIPAAHINEKFPMSTPHDEYLMGKQHMIIKDKLRVICSLVSASLNEDALTATSSMYDNPSLSGEVQEKLPPEVPSDVLQPEIYRHLLPEIQRMDLVLASTRFYFDLNELSQIFGRMDPDYAEDLVYWPVPHNYTPPNIFERSPFDINLTFGEYGKDDSQADRTSNLLANRSSSLRTDQAVGVAVQQDIDSAATQPATAADGNAAGQVD